jgi:hypothetical protein
MHFLLQSGDPCPQLWGMPVASAGLQCGAPAGTPREGSCRGIERASPSVVRERREHMSIRIAIAMFCAALFFSSPGTADQWNKKTILTFGQSVQLPGVSLPPGTYVFKVPADLNYRHVVQVFNADETEILATIIANSSERQTGADRTTLRFGEGAKGLPEPLQKWFYPQEKTGNEFIYSKER